MMAMRTLVKRISGTAGHSVSFLRVFSSVAGGRVGMSILGPGAVQPAGSKRTDALAIHQTVLFTSTCPRCEREQTQSFTRASLRRLLDAGYPVEGYCVMCDQFWELSSRERLQLAKILGS
jgi:hypothetical protein